MRARTSACLLLITGLAAAPAQAGWFDFLFGDDEAVEEKVEEIKGKVEDIRQAGDTVKQLSEGDIVTGLKQALEKGAGHAVDELGVANGFLDNPRVKIPMPDKLEKLERALRKIGKQEYADRFVVSMNRAAESAVPLTMDILKTGIRELTIDDARTILEGPDDAATRYLQKTGSDQLHAKLHPIVAKSTDAAGVTASYKKMLGKLSFLGNYVDMEEYDLDNYVTDRTMDGLFTMIAEQEKLIREDPAARTTEILKQVFGK